jgi:quinol-cytochrome oxidoreductase complex cytochrome b subunit
MVNSMPEYEAENTDETTEPEPEELEPSEPEPSEEEVPEEEPGEVEAEAAPTKPAKRPEPGGVARWFGDRFDSCDLFDSQIAAERHRTGLEEGAAPVDYIGKAMWVVFVLIVISGIGLFGGYVPTISGAFNSVERIQTDFTFGWWFRGVHKWGTDLFIILAIARLVRLAYRRGYKSTGEFGWIWALAVLAIGMTAGLTGYLLVWHQRAFWMGSILQSNPLSFEGVRPLGGLGLKGWAAELITGGTEITASALTGIFVLHITLALAIVVPVFCRRLAKRRMVPKFRNLSFYVPPGLLWTVLGVLTFIALILPPPTGSPSDGILKPNPIIADWFFLGCYQLIDMLTPTIAGWIIGIGFLIGILLPWIDRSRVKGPRPAVTALIVAALFTWLALTLKALEWNISAPVIFIIIAIFWIIAFVLAAMAEYQPLKPEEIEAVEVVVEVDVDDSDEEEVGVE